MKKNTLLAYFTSSKEDKYGVDLYLEYLFDEKLHISYSRPPTRVVEPEPVINEGELILIEHTFLSYSCLCLKNCHW